MRTPRGEIVGVVEILNKRRRNFTKEDEEFLAEVGTHAALAVEGVREHEAAVAPGPPRGRRRRLQGRLAAPEPDRVARDAGLRVGAAALALARSPTSRSTPSSPRPGRLSLLLLEDRREIEDAIGALVRASDVGAPAARRLGVPTEIVARDRGAGAGLLVTAARLGGRSRQPGLRAEAARTLPPALRTPGSLRDPGVGRDARSRRVETGEGRPPRLASQRAVRAAQSAGKPAPRAETRAVQRLARAAETQPLSAAFAALVAEWKKTGSRPGARDVLLLAAKTALTFLSSRGAQRRGTPF